MCYICEQEKQVQAGTTEFWNPETQRINVAELADAVRQASLNDPNKVYQRPKGSGCLYTHEADDGQGLVPGCIVGQAVFNITGNVVQQSALNTAVNGSAWVSALHIVEGEVVDGDFTLVKDPLTRYLVRWLRNVQSKQDDGNTWAKSVAYADENTTFGRFAG